MSGQVIDVTTGMPLADVWIVARHERGGGIPFPSSPMWCVKTVGIYTDAQGRFRFTYEEGYEPKFLAIKPGYYRESELQYVDGIPQQFPRPIDYKEYDKNYPDPHQHVNVYLRPQDRKNVKHDYGYDALCDRATSLEDVQPMIEFRKIEIEAFKKYPADPSIIPSLWGSIERQKQLVKPIQKKQ